MRASAFLAISTEIRAKHSGYAAPQDQMRLSSLDHLEVFDGILMTCEKKTCMIIPAALKVMHLKSIWKSAYLGYHKVGWKYQSVTTTLMEKRKGKARVHYGRKKWKQGEKNMERKSANTPRSSRTMDSQPELNKLVSFMVGLTSPSSISALDVGIWGSHPGHNAG